MMYRCREAANILSWTKAVVILLEESVTSGDIDSYLEDLDVHLLSLDFVRKILSRRIYV